MRAFRTRRGVAIISALAAALVAGTLPVIGAASASAEEGCEVEYTVASNWGSGFQANVTITAGSEPIDGWDLTWAFPAGTTVSQAWNVGWSQTGTTFHGSDVGWNASIPAGRSVQFGFVGSGSTASPSYARVNGDLCNGVVLPTPPKSPPTPPASATPSATPTVSPAPSPTTPTDPPTPAGPVKIMPMGDSITGSPGCWRGNLWQLLDTAGHEVDFVGGESQACNPAASDADHEGHGGYLVTQSVSNGNTYRWMQQNTPDVLLLHFGTNDVWSNLPPSQILAAYTSIVTDLRTLNPDATILVAQIIPLEPAPSFGCTDCAQRAIDLNAQIPAWAAENSTEESPIVVVDQWTGFDPDTDTYDGVHPDEDGNVKIAARWFEALDRVLP
ncbi:cellulose binding domain-containing protein [Myceligenerans crystallogenes]|uniref:CBM2 domain-containing protein n=1 Tax=Myceligenerans crystallogenes TaxID=316335 RepID=A0ABN2N2M7_9MICO